MEPGAGGGEIPLGRRRWRASVSALAHPQFRWLFASNLGFFFAMNAQFLVRSYLAFKLTDSPLALGFVNLAVAVPLLVVAPFGGVIADRVERRGLILAGQAGVILSELVILVLLLTGALEFWHLMAVVGVLGFIFPFVMPARQAIIVNIVGKRGLANAMALSMTGMNASRVVGPVMAGFLISLVGIEITYALVVSLFGVAWLGMLRVNRSHPPEREPGRSIFDDLLGGLRYLRATRPVLVLLVLGLVPMLLAMPFQTLLVVFAEKVWHVGSKGFGLLQMMAGIGGVAGSAYVTLRGESHARLRVMMVSLLAFGACLTFFSLSPWFLLALPLVLAGNAVASVFTTLNNTAVQLLIPDEVRGRVMSLMLMSFGLTPLATLPLAALAEVAGAPVAVCGASLLLIAISVAFYVASPTLRRIDRHTREAVERPEIPREPPIREMQTAAF